MYTLFSDSGQSKKWFFQRKYRVTGSAIAGVLGKSPFSSLSKTVLQMLGVYRTPSNPAIEHGIKHEPVARKWYEQEYQVTVHEVGFALSKCNTYLGVSVDGCVGKNGIIEIKCPQRMYRPLVEYEPPSQKPENYKGSLYEPFYSHIYETHYLQMQLGMYILERKWCDYIVYTKEEKFVQKVLYDVVYFEEMLQELEYFYPKYDKVLSEIGLRLLPANKGLSKGSVKKQEAIKAVHEVFQNDCTCGGMSETILECCLRN